VNPAYEEETGLLASDLVGRAPRNIYGDAGSQMEARYEQCMAKQEPLEYEEELPIGGETTIWSARIPPVVVGGEVQKVAGSTRDVTERKEMEWELRETREFYKQIFDQVPIDLAVFGREGRFVQVNFKGVSDPERHKQTLGKTNEEYFRERGFDPEIGRWWDEAIQKALETGEPNQIEETLRTEGGPVHYPRVQGPVTDSDGEVTHVAGCGVDLTERKRYEERLREAKREAERSREEAEAVSRAKSAFLASMSHEPRTPLTSIIGFAEAIGKEAGAPEEAGDSAPEGVQVVRFADLTEGSGRRLMETLDAVSNLSKLEAEEMSLKARPVDLGEQAREIAEELRPQAKESGPSLVVETEKAEAWADEGGVQIVLQNLLSNVVKYTEKGA